MRCNYCGCVIYRHKIEFGGRIFHLRCLREWLMPKEKK